MSKKGHEMNREMIRALKADGEKLRQLTGEDHGPFEIPDAPCLECDGSGWLDDEQTKICCECDGTGLEADE